MYNHYIGIIECIAWNEFKKLKYYHFEWTFIEICKSLNLHSLNKCDLKTINI